MKVWIGAGWMISSLVAFAVVFGLSPYLNDDETTTAIPSINSFLRISYGAFHRSAFALFVAWVIFTCTLQHAGTIQSSRSIVSTYSLSLIQFQVLSTVCCRLKSSCR